MKKAVKCLLPQIHKKVSRQLLQWFSTKRTVCLNGSKAKKTNICIYAVLADKMTVLAGFATFHIFFLAAAITNSSQLFTPSFFHIPIGKDPLKSLSRSLDPTGIQFSTLLRAPLHWLNILHAQVEHV
ncbi:hypothetical protein [Candidatus Caldatribacterium saccharofermentans]|uniref:hypothetical protein n=1 Tax=Candidatus Caldatribacterium saccharofermentans TaxID=1454753 RepID=UPI003CFF2DF8